MMRFARNIETHLLRDINRNVVLLLLLFLEQAPFDGPLAVKARLLDKQRLLLETPGKHRGAIQAPPDC